MDKYTEELLECIAANKIQVLSVFQCDHKGSSCIVVAYKEFHGDDHLTLFLLNTKNFSNMIRKRNVLDFQRWLKDLHMEVIAYTENPRLLRDICGFSFAGLVKRRNRIYSRMIQKAEE